MGNLACRYLSLKRYPKRSVFPLVLHTVRKVAHDTFVWVMPVDAPTEKKVRRPRRSTLTRVHASPLFPRTIWQGHDTNYIKYVRALNPRVHFHPQPIGNEGIATDARLGHRNKAG
jgi:hypothetical protein